MGIAARERQQQRDRGAERGDLREREVDEDDAPLHDVDAEIGVDAGEDQAGGEGREQEAEHVEIHLTGPRVALMAPHEQVQVVVEELEVVRDLLLASDRGRHHHHRGARLACRSSSVS